MCFILIFDLLRNSRLTVPMYADRRELLVFQASSTVSQRVEKVFRHAEAPSDEGAGFLRSKKTGGEIFSSCFSPSVFALRRIHLPHHTYTSS